MTKDLENTCPAKTQRLILIRSAHVTSPKPVTDAVGEAAEYVFLHQRLGHGIHDPHQELRPEDALGFGKCIRKGQSCE